VTRVIALLLDETEKRPMANAILIRRVKWFGHRLDDISGFESTNILNRLGSFLNLQGAEHARPCRLGVADCFFSRFTDDGLVVLCQCV
jgi:hypothetical protein